MIIAAALNTRRQRALARKWNESLRIKHTTPLGEDEIVRPPAERVAVKLAEPIARRWFYPETGDRNYREKRGGHGKRGAIAMSGNHDSNPVSRNGCMCPTAPPASKVPPQPRFPGPPR